MPYVGLRYMGVIRVPTPVLFLSLCLVSPFCGGLVEYVENFLQNIEVMDLDDTR